MRLQSLFELVDQVPLDGHAPRLNEEHERVEVSLVVTDLLWNFQNFAVNDPSMLDRIVLEELWFRLRLDELFDVLAEAAEQGFPHLVLLEDGNSARFVVFL